MITKEEFLTLFRKTSGDVSALEPELEDFEHVAEMARKVWRDMPGIGLASVNGRINCFLAVCRHLDTLISEGQIDLSQSQLILIMLRMKDKKFLKAITMFDTRAARLGPLQRAELPKSAREYLAGLEMFG
jgi:hypothetical protein